MFDLLVADEAVFRSGENAFEVGAMTPDCEGAGREGEDKEGFVPNACFPEGRLGFVAVNMTDTIFAMSQDGQAQGGEDAGEGNIAAEVERDEEEGEHPQKDEGHEGDQNSGRGGDTLAALAAKEEGVIVPHDGGHRGNDLDGVNRELLRDRDLIREAREKGDGDRRQLSMKVKDVRDEDHGNEALQKIEKETEEAKAFSDHPEDVGGADIAGSMLRDIDAPGLRDEHPEGDRPDEVSENGKEPGHGGEPGQQRRRWAALY